MDCDKLKQMSEITIDDAFFKDLWEQDKLNFKEDLENPLGRQNSREAPFDYWKGKDFGSQPVGVQSPTVPVLAVFSLVTSPLGASVSLLIRGSNTATDLLTGLNGICVSRWTHSRSFKMAA